jgi:FAD/FMN-containing dehydrogenase
MLRTPPVNARRKPTWRFWAVLGVVALVVVLLSRPVYHVARSAMVHRVRETPTSADFVDDASRLNSTAVATIVRALADSAAAESQLEELLQRARREKLQVAIAGARHTMGGHTITPNGIVIDMTTFRGMALSADSNALLVRAGTRWSEVIPFLDRHRRSLPVMQSNNSFTVGGSLSANAHGWQHDHPPMASMVRAVRIMTADGVIRRATRAENAELFRLALGGYGLFGIILDVELRTTRNELYRMRRYDATGDSYEETYARYVSGNAGVGMAYGRLSVSPSSFLTEATLTAFVRDSAAGKALPTVTAPGLLGVKRAVLRGSEQSDYGKELRWTLEKRLGELPGSSRFTRNQLLNEPAEFFANTSEATTDVLHEYFVPQGKLPDFIRRIRPVLVQSRADLLNVTIRNVLPDSDSFLAYARVPVWGLVMLFTQERSSVGETRMQDVTRQLIDAVLAVGGTYYLPYRLHASRGQFLRAYPMAPEFFALKRKYDPDDVFSNQWYRMYGASR